MRSLLILILFATPSFGQEIVEIKQVEPQTKIYVKLPNNMVIVTNLEELSNTTGVAGPRNIQLLNDQNLLNNLELVPEQRESLKKLRERLQEQTNEIKDDYRDRLNEAESPEQKLELANQYLKRVNELKESFAKEISAVVTLPHQNELMARYSFQQNAKRLGFYKAVLTHPFVDELELKGDQRKEIEKIIQETDEETKRQIKKLRDAAEQKIIRLLDADQKEYLETMRDPVETGKK